MYTKGGRLLESREEKTEERRKEYTGRIRTRLRREAKKASGLRE